MPKKRTIAIFPSMATFLVFTYYDPASFFSKREPLSIPSPPNIPDIIWTATVDHLSPSFSLFLVRLLRNSLSAEGEGWREEGGRDGRRRWKTSDVCPRGIVIFIGSQLSRGFSFSCPAVPCRRLLPLPREKPAAMKTLLFMRRKASPVVWMFRFGLFDMSVDRIARDDPTELSDPLLKINM